MLPNKSQFHTYLTGHVPPPAPLPKNISGDYRELSEMLSIQNKQVALMRNQGLPFIRE